MLQFAAIGLILLAKHVVLVGDEERRQEALQLLEGGRMLPGRTGRLLGLLRSLGCFGQGLSVHAHSAAQPPIGDMLAAKTRHLPRTRHALDPREKPQSQHLLIDSFRGLGRTR